MLVSDVNHPMITIPGGKIEMRDDRKKSNWEVEIKPFLLAQYPVTRELFHAIFQQPAVSLVEKQMPVVNVSWSGASCRRRSHPTLSIDDLGFRLAWSK